MTDLFESYEKDFLQCISLLEEQLSQPNKNSYTSKDSSLPEENKQLTSKYNPFEFEEAQKLVPSHSISNQTRPIAETNGDNDNIRKRVAKNKSEFDRVRRELRKIQNTRAKENMKQNDQFGIVKSPHSYLMALQEMENIQVKEDRLVKQNNRQLQSAVGVGLACEDMANDIKVNLGGQTNKMQNSVMKNLYEIQGNSTVANRLMAMIKKERVKNRIILYSVLIFIALTILFIIFH